MLHKYWRSPSGPRETISNVTTEVLWLQTWAGVNFLPSAALHQPACFVHICPILSSRCQLWGQAPWPTTFPWGAPWAELLCRNGRAVNREVIECCVRQRNSSQLPACGAVFTVVEDTQKKTEGLCPCSSLKPTVSSFGRFNWITIFITVTLDLSLSW